MRESNIPVDSPLGCSCTALHGWSRKGEIVPMDGSRYRVNQGVFVQTDQPIMSCLGCQYADGPWRRTRFFAMGSGPMRLARGRETLLESLKLSERVDQVVGVLESEVLPSEAALRRIASECRVEVGGVEDRGCSRDLRAGSTRWWLVASKRLYISCMNCILTLAQWSLRPESPLCRHRRNEVT